MNIEISLLDGQKLQANLGQHQIISDQSISAGGEESYPEPFDYFLASMPLCAGFYIRKFCDSRGISTEGIKLTQEHATIGEDKYHKRFSISVTLPQGFPDKYKKALLAAANTCTVKKVIQAMPEFDIQIAD
ncbi:OsmC family protein [Paraglaciecola arctica]|uniref:Ribosomal protein S12 methylthiotransferase n=1 Tax=Paraglaciecola arctica BSs20135 TaxID=493475 RepID=K6YL41_9ALTE|nr:OsmC family protein [Paraglaciecola arctica]GAC18867.1 ribosomal protein S12 methylthiotransferase [Paraglaciecola arctica BSs20135]